MRVALDTNLLVYAEGVAFLPSDTHKPAVVHDLLDAVPAEDVVVPAQVLGELYRVLTGKVKRPATEVRTAILNWCDLYAPVDTTAAVMMARQPEISLVDEARRRRPGLVVWAAARGRPEAVALLVELGFDVNAYGRGDAPVEQGWETALHVAAGGGDASMVRLLLSLGADPALRDTRFDATPAAWARHRGHVELLGDLRDFRSA